MKNFMRIDAKKCQIIMDKTFYNRSLYFGTEEYNLLQMARKDYPGFTPVRREIRKPDHTIDRHKGLTYVYMENYIRKCEPEETREEILSAFERMKDIAKAHAPGTSYNHIKKWFLERYTEVSSFEIKENCEEEIFEPDTGLNTAIQKEREEK